MSGATPSIEARLAALQQRLGHVFKDERLLREALTHASALDAGKTHKRSYDRLEFLGDRVLALMVSARLYQEHQNEDEGDLAQRFNALVNRRACAKAAKAANLGEALILSPSEASQGGRSKEAILADACEAVIAALYLDAGFEAAQTFITTFWGDAFEAVKAAPRDAKTVLQEWAAARKKHLLYAEVQRSGPEHAPHFVIEARVDGFAPARGEGGAKRDAQRAAAAAFLREHGLDG